MKERIILAKKTDCVQVETSTRSLCVHHKLYDPPQVEGRTILFDEFKESPRSLLSGADRLIFVGMNKMINPGNRTQMVFEVTHNNTESLDKVSIDRSLFVAEPWRMWFHWGAVSEPFGDYTYSYIAESHYNAWLEEARDENPFCLDNVLAWSRGVVRSLYQNFFDQLSIESRKTMEYDKAEYQRVKEHAFTQETTAKGVIRRLSRFAQECCPERSIPSPSKMFDSDFLRIVKTDLPVDNWLVSQIKGYISLNDGVCQDRFNGSDG